MSRKGLEVFAYVSLGTNTKERMNVSKVSGVVVW
jgi:hypothetical protein